MEKAVSGGVEGLAKELSRRVGGAGRGQEQRDIFELPALPPGSQEVEDSSSDSGEEAGRVLEMAGMGEVEDVYQVDVKSRQFLSLPKELQYQVLNDLKGKRKQNSWAVMHQMPKVAEDFSSFQLERLKRRKEIAAKLDSVSQEMSCEVADVIDQSLFVGDREGIRRRKQEVRSVMRVASQPNSHILLVSGRSQEQEKVQEQGAGSSKEAAPEEVRELYSSDEMDDPGVGEAMAQSLAESGGPSQEVILQMIRKEARGGGRKGVRGGVRKEARRGVRKEVRRGVKKEVIKVEDLDSDDDVVLLPDATVLISSRFGGRAARHFEVKQEVIEKDVKKETAINGGVKKEVTEDEVVEKEAVSDTETEAYDGVGEMSEVSVSDTARTGGVKQEVIEEQGVEKEAVSDAETEACDGVGVKQEVIEEEAASEAETEAYDDVGEMSESSESDGDMVSVKSEEEEDLFADVFNNDESIEELTTIVDRAKLPVAKPKSRPIAQPVEEDMFADIFKDSDSVEDIMTIVEKAKVPHLRTTKEPVAALRAVGGSESNPLAAGVLEKVAKLGKIRDIFADIAATGRSLVRPESQEKEESSVDFRKEVIGVVMYSVISTVTSIIMCDHLYLHNSSGDGFPQEQLQFDLEDSEPGSRGGAEQDQEEAGGG